MKLFLLLSLVWTLALADMPVDCRYSDIVGTWLFHETQRNGTHRPNCDDVPPEEVVHTKVMKLSYPNIVTDEFDNQGTWTLIYNQGFEVRVSGRSYFAYSYFEKDVSLCGRTFAGWSRGLTVKNWSCYVGNKTTHVDPRPTNEPLPTAKITVTEEDQEDMIRRINAKQNNWTAKKFSGAQKLYDGLKTRKRFIRDTSLPKPKRSPVTEAIARSLPRSWDWRNIAGIDYVRPVKNQGHCGSCYAFASVGAIESQVLIHSNATDVVDLSVQDIIGCSKLSQGCEGGFQYLIAGRYAQEQGFILENCNPYTARDGPCKDRSSCRKIYTTDYKYVGGYLGACNEAEMMVSLVENGPMAIGIQVYPDLRNYHNGVYHHTKESLVKFDPFEETNHAVLLVGYGVSDEGEKYWTIQNSWGTNWGMSGYGNIRRGTDEIGIESAALISIAYP